MEVEKKLIKPVGELQIFASFGLISWAVDEEGKKFIKWDQKEWVPAEVEYEKEKNEEKIRKK